MSATAYPYGMIPVENLSAGQNTQGFETFEIHDGESTAIYFGDVVKLDGTYGVVKDTGTTTLTPIGVFIGCRYTNSVGQIVDSQYWPAITTGYSVYAKVVSNPFAIFRIQGAGSVTMAMLGANGDIVQTAGTSVYGKSRNAFATTTPDTTSTRPLRIVGFAQTPENAIADAYTDILVKFNTHAYNVTTGT